MSLSTRCLEQCPEHNNQPSLCTYKRPHDFKLHWPLTGSHRTGLQTESPGENFLGGLMHHGPHAALWEASQVNIWPEKRPWLFTVGIWADGPGPWLNILTLTLETSPWRLTQDGGMGTQGGGDKRRPLSLLEESEPSGLGSDSVGPPHQLPSGR